MIAWAGLSTGSTARFGVNAGYTRHVASNREMLIETLQRTAEALPDVDVLVFNRDIVARKLARARSWVADAAGRLDQPRDAFLANADSRDLATFHVFTALRARGRQHTLD